MKKYNSQDIESVFDFLSTSSSTLSIHWESYLKKMNKETKRLYYFDMMEISRVIVDMFHLKKSEELKIFFERVETIYFNADFEIKSLLGAGLIEGIQQICQNEEINIKQDFNPWLLEATKKEWDEIASLLKQKEN
jgi:hypothetical protein